MKGVVSFHPFDVGLFEVLLDPLIRGEKVNPESFLDAAYHRRVADWRTTGYRAAIALLLEETEPPELPSEGPLLGKLRARLERFEYRPPPVVRLLAEKIEPEIHLRGRPFLITEGSADRVGAFCDEYLGTRDVTAVDGLVVEQLLRLDRSLPGEIEPELCGDPPATAPVRAELLERLKAIYDLAHAARAGGEWGNVGVDRRPARRALAEELPWRCVSLHAEVVPFWVGDDVDGLVGLCESAGIGAPGCVQSARPLFYAYGETFPEIVERLTDDLDGPRTVGAYVPANDVDELLTFLSEQGARIIREATRQGVGRTCSRLLTKIRECASYASKHGTGYLEASGIDLPELPVAETSDAGTF